MPPGPLLKKPDLYLDPHLSDATDNLPDHQDEVLKLSTKGTRAKRQTSSSVAAGIHSVDAPSPPTGKAKGKKRVRDTKAMGPPATEKPGQRRNSKPGAAASSSRDINETTTPRPGQGSKRQLGAAASSRDTNASGSSTTNGRGSRHQSTSSHLAQEQAPLLGMDVIILGMFSYIRGRF